MLRQLEPQLRQALDMAALVAARRNPAIREFYQRLRQAGKPPKVALTACMRKILVILNAMLKNHTLLTHSCISQLDKQDSRSPAKGRGYLIFRPPGFRPWGRKRRLWCLYLLRW